jgi:hypothetical protein
MKKLSKNQKIVLVLLILAIIFGWALTPLGFETRTPDLRTWAIVPFFISASLLIPIIALSVLFKKPRVAGVLVIINALVMLLLVPGDQAGFFFTSAVPPVITVFEFLSVFVSAGFLIWGPALLHEKRTRR